MAKTSGYQAGGTPAQALVGEIIRDPFTGKPRDFTVYEARPEDFVPRYFEARADNFRDWVMTEEGWRKITSTE